MYTTGHNKQANKQLTEHAEHALGHWERRKNVKKRGKKKEKKKNEKKKKKKRKKERRDTHTNVCVHANWCGLTHLHPVTAGFFFKSNDLIRGHRSTLIKSSHLCTCYFLSYELYNVTVDSDTTTL